MRIFPKHMRKTIIDPQLRKNLVKLINETFKVDITDVCRKQEYVFGRMIYYRILRDLGYGYQPIGRTLGKDHSTIIHNIRAFDDITTYDKELHKTYEIIKDLVIKDIELPDMEQATYGELVRSIVNLEEENAKLKKQLAVYKNIKLG